MKTIRTSFKSAWPGHPVNLAAGDRLTIDAGGGSVALLLKQGDDWQAITAPYEAAADCVVRLDCLAAPEPFTATLYVANGSEE